MSEQDIAGVLNEAIDRLAAGDSINEIVARDPQRGPQIHPMLEAGLLTRRALYPATEIRESLARIDSQVLPNLPPAATFPYWLIVPLLIGVGLLVVIFAAASNSSTPASPAATMTIAATETGVIATQEASPSVVPAAIDQSGTATPNAVISSTADQTGLAPSAAADATPTTERSVRFVIEGAVQRIEGHTVTILEQNILLLETPALSVIQVGDVLRLDGQIDTQKHFIHVTIIFVSVDVIVNTDGQVWRDPGTCDSPPDWARSAASRWLGRCNASAPPSAGNNSSGGGNSGGGGNNNDDDD